MLDYENLYRELGNLFYAIACTDGKVSKNEIKMINSLLVYQWRPLEKSKDSFGTDAANFILFQFDLNEETGAKAEDKFESFASFFEENYNEISSGLKEKILTSARTIAESTRNINNPELKILMKLRYLVAHGHLNKVKE